LHFGWDEPAFASADKKFIPPKAGSPSGITNTVVSY